jgi:CheY-like chemotaxis protein
MTKMLAQLLGHGVEVAILPRAAEARVKADSGQMHQVILNLFLNARDAMPRGGRLEISTGEVDLKRDDLRRLPEAAPGRYVELAIRDTGEGMSEETQAHIFEPFFTTKPAGQGTGLGLATVYGIVRQSGGHIDVETAPGKGTTFRILLPLAVGDTLPEPEPSAMPGLQTTGSAARILLVDDAAAIRKVLRRILENGGYRVTEAATADDASAILGREPVDVLLTDLEMPGRSGVDLARETRREHPGVKVIAMSAFEDAQLGDLPRELGIEAALAKPMPPETLLEAVRDAMEKKSFTKSV